MLNKKRQGFTLMEIVLVMVLIAILATGVAIGFTSYINRGHETGITTDYNSTFQNPVRMTAIEKGRIVTVKQLYDTVIEDGFILSTSNENWTATATGKGTVTDAPATDAVTAFVEKGNKRYIIEKIGFTEPTATEPGKIAAVGTGADAIQVTADHSSKRTTAIYVLNEAKNDVVTYIGTVKDGKLTVD